MGCRQQVLPAPRGFRVLVLRAECCPLPRGVRRSGEGLGPQCGLYVTALGPGWREPTIAPALRAAQAGPPLPLPGEPCPHARRLEQLLSANVQSPQEAANTTRGSWPSVGHPAAGSLRLWGKGSARPRGPTPPSGPALCRRAVALSPPHTQCQPQTRCQPEASWDGYSLATPAVPYKGRRCVSVPFTTAPGNSALLERKGSPQRPVVPRKPCPSLATVRGTWKKRAAWESHSDSAPPARRRGHGTEGDRPKP